MQIPLINGIGATERADFTVRYPVNLEPVPIDSGISKGYLRSASGARSFATGPGLDRGGVVWNGTHYRVMGTKLVSVSTAGVVTTLGDVGGAGPVTLDYGFGRLAIRSGTNLFYWDGATLTQVTDTDLGQCLDVVWMDGYYISTDGTDIVVTNLTDPTQVDPLRYGSAESDPDPITGLIRLRSELFALGQNTIQVYTDAGGTGFPFQPSEGATIPVGCVGPMAKARFTQTFAFVGSARNQALAVWIAGSGTATKISDRAIDDMLAEVADPTSIVLEARVMRNEQKLLVHLPDKTLVCCNVAGEAAGQPVWYIARSGRGADKAYRLRNAVLQNGNWIVGDTESNALGILDDAVATHFGEPVGWQFDTMLMHNGTKSVIVHQLELVGLPGRGDQATAFFSYTLDGEAYSNERSVNLGRRAERQKRMTISPHRRFRNYMGVRFRGDSSALAGFASLEATLEQLSA